MTTRTSSGCRGSSPTHQCIAGCHGNAYSGCTVPIRQQCSNAFSRKATKLQLTVQYKTMRYGSKTYRNTIYITDLLHEFSTVCWGRCKDSRRGRAASRMLGSVAHHEHDRNVNIRNEIHYENVNVKAIRNVISVTRVKA